MKKKEKIEKLKGEVFDLKSRIAELKFENDRLREIIKKLTEEHKSANNTENNVKEEQENFPDSNMNLEKIFEHCYLIDDNGAKTKKNLVRLKNTLTKNGYRDLKCLEGKTIYEVLRFRYLGLISIAIMIIICNHYGVHIDFDGRRKAEEEKIKVLISKYEGRIYFTD